MIKVIEERKLYFNLDASCNKLISIVACNLYTDGNNYFIRLGVNNLFIEDLKEIDYEIDLFDENNEFISTIKGSKKLGIKSKYARDIFDENKVSKNVYNIKIRILNIKYLTCNYTQDNFDFMDYEHVNPRKCNKPVEEYKHSFNRSNYTILVCVMMFLILLLIRFTILFSQLDFNTIFN